MGFLYIGSGALGHLLLIAFPLMVLFALAVFLLYRKFIKSRVALARTRQKLNDVAAQEAIFHAIAQHANDGLVFQDMEARIIWANPAYCRTMGYALEEIIGRKPQEFCFPPEAKPSDQEIADFRFDPDDETFNSFHRHPNIRKNGDRFWQEFSQAVIELQSGEKRVILVSRDITQQVEREQELERAKAVLSHAADHDALTGLLNRTAFLLQANEALRKARQGKDHGALGLLYIDLDHFKAINDSHGHAVGDKVLRHVAKCMETVGGERGVSCRIGGDEFILAVPDVGTFDALQLMADTLLEQIRAPIDALDTKLRCNASIGIALSSGGEALAEDLIRSADFALYEAKAPGAPSIARFDATLHLRQEREKAMMEEFADTLDRDGIDFQYQPILDGRTGKIRSFETLARWTRSNGEIVPPDRFLPFAARLNRMTDIDLAAVRATTRLVARLQERGHTILGAFNTSSEALAHADFLPRLEAEAREAGLASDRLIAEVLETTFFGADTTDNVAAARINQLRESGYSVYLDDFGVGYAGLAHLSQLNVSGVKLDRSLVANVTHDRSARIITTSILSLCHTLGVGTLAEGIETAEQADFLLQHGCYHLQGFGIARPMSADAVIAMVEAGEEIVIPSEHDLPADLCRAS